MVQMSFTLPMPHSKVAEGAAQQLANKMGMDPAMVVHAKAMGPDFTFFVVYGRVHHLVEVDKVQVVERDYPLLSPKEANLAIRKTAAPPAGRGRRLHRHRRAHGRHRRDPQHQGVRGGEGPGVLPGDQGREPRRPGLGAPAGRPCAGREGRRGAGLPGRHASATPTCSTPRRCRRRSARPTPTSAGPCSSSAAPGSTRPAPTELGVDRIFARGTTPADVASYLVHTLGARHGRPLEEAS